MNLQIYYWRITWSIQNTFNMSEFGNWNGDLYNRSN